METILGLSLLINGILGYKAYKDSQYDYEGVARMNKIRDDEYRQLLFDYFTKMHGGDSKKAVIEQASFYNLARSQKKLDGYVN